MDNRVLNPRQNTWLLRSVFGGIKSLIEGVAEAAFRCGRWRITYETSLCASLFCTAVWPSSNLVLHLTGDLD
jgi:hypothetical protein